MKMKKLPFFIGLVFSAVGLLISAGALVISWRSYETARNSQDLSEKVARQSSESEARNIVAWPRVILEHVQPRIDENDPGIRLMGTIENKSPVPAFDLAVMAYLPGDKPTAERSYQEHAPEWAILRPQDSLPFRIAIDTTSNKEAVRIKQRATTGLLPITFYYFYRDHFSRRHWMKDEMLVIDGQHVILHTYHSQIESSSVAQEVFDFLRRNYFVRGTSTDTGDEK